MDELQDRTIEATKQINLVTDRFARRDLDRMLKTVREALDSLDKESVECRRLQRPTTKYESLKQLAEDRILNLEKHLTLAMLLR
jgi:hypothetical protein